MKRIPKTADVPVSRAPRNRLDEITRAVVACEACPRLRSHCRQTAREKRRAYRDWEYWGRPIPGWGDPGAGLLIIGLAPAAHGGNRTGRMFTGDSSGDWLFRALHRAGFANQPTSEHKDDGLALHDAYITAVARCAPPQNKPTAEELNRCAPFLEAEIQALERVRAVLVLGKVAFDRYVRILRRGFPEALRRARPSFSHGASFSLGRDLPVLISSYHPSRQNTQTGRLTEEMFDQVFHLARRVLDAAPSEEESGGR